ncbi:hypothetical protein D3C78_1939340 [compost metagenome]
MVPSTPVPSVALVYQVYLSAGSGLLTVKTVVLPGQSGLSAPDTDGGGNGIAPAFTTTGVREVLLQVPDEAST